MKTMLVPVLASSLILLSTGFVSAEVPSTMSYQGRLTDDSGQPVTDSSYSFVFAIYDTAAAGTPLWSENQTVSTQDGLFTVELGSVDPLPETVFQSSPRYLGISVNGNPEQSPRNRLTTAPYAFQAAMAPATTGQGPETSWICPVFKAFRFGSDLLEATVIYFYNPNDQGGTYTLTFYSMSGVQLDQCAFAISAYGVTSWSSINAVSCANASPDGAAMTGWFSIQSDLPMVPWGYYISNFPSMPVFAVPLSFYVP